MSMHLVILTPGFPENEEDSSCIPPLQDFVKTLALTKKSWKISIVSFHYPYQKHQYKWNDINVFCAGGKNGKGWKKVRTWARVWNYLKHLNKSSPINLLHSFWLGECAMLGKYKGRRLRIPHLCTLMGQDARAREYKYFRLKAPTPSTGLPFSVSSQGNYSDASGLTADHLIPWGISPDDYPEH